ncbi:alpha/beta hydrolase [Methanobrevibacter sp. OttesenSCG-928-K11]|nr:alpha/beta hydrolase [Methanobrevibacter sp. OttesenSCG-928-K11]
MKSKKDIQYGSKDKQKLDIYIPDKSNDAAIIVIHGGGWWQGDKQKEILLPKKLSNEGYLVIVPNYRLVEEDENLYPSQIQDMEKVIDWLKESDYEFNPEKIGVFGSSSGGNLASELCVRHGYPTTTWSALIDLDTFYNTHLDTIPKKIEIKENTPSSEIDQTGSNDEYYKWLIINLLGGDMSKLEKATVINNVCENSGVMFLVNSLDELVPHTEILKMAKALADKGKESQTLLLKGNRHGEAYYDDAIDLTLKFFKKYLN